MAIGDEKYLNSSLIAGFRKIIEDDRIEKKMNKTSYGKTLQYIAQPGFCNITNGKALPGLRALIEITDELGYDIVFVKRDQSKAPKTDETNDAT